MKSPKFFVVILLTAIAFPQLRAQTTSTSSNLVVQALTDRTITFNVTDAGVAKPITWGLDLAWLSESNIRRGIAFMGADRVDVVRASFQPTLPLVSGDLQAAQIADLNTRLNWINLTGAKTKVVLNCDHPSVDASYIGNAANWAALIKATTKRVQARGRTVVSISPFNEPDYGWGQYSGSNGQSDFLNIIGELRKDTLFDKIRICGGNTLNCDQALPWYNYLKTKLDEGNTHQLAGTFDNYASFFQTVRTNGDHATADELHNVMEAMVGVEYGMQTGIWWGTAELARAEFVKASDGVRLGYAEHRPNWTAASVYRNTDGKVQAFGGTSERQGVTTTYRFVSKDRDVYFDGYGPQREYTMILPGGTAYQTGQSNAEKMVNITWGADIQPVVNGKYKVVNRMSGKVLEIPSGNTASGVGLCQRTYKSVTYQQWNVNPVDSRIGGDFSYHSFVNVASAKVPDVLNFSLDNNANIIQWDNNKNGNQQWFLEYAEDGWFYIRNRNSAKCLSVGAPYTTEGAAILQTDKAGAANQQWRFLPVDAPIEFAAPTAPANLVATANATSVRLDWTANSESDLAAYTIFRTDTAGRSYSTIARNVKSISFVDNTATYGKQYFYCVKAVDNSLNNSGYSVEVSATVSADKDLVAQYKFDSNTLDSTINLNHGATYGAVAYADGRFTGKGISLNGTDAFVQLPPNVVNHQEITISAWIYWNGITTSQQIFNFGNDQNQYMYLTPKTIGGQMRFGIKNGGTEQTLNATTSLPMVAWSHVAVTLGSAGVRLFVNGVQVAQSTTITIKPTDFKPVLNYLGRSQTSAPTFNGIIDDFRVYNYALSASEVQQISGLFSEDVSGVDYSNNLTVSPVPVNDILHVSFSASSNNHPSTLALYDTYGKQVMNQNRIYGTDAQLNVSNLPTGIYILKVTTGNATMMRKITKK